MDVEFKTTQMCKCKRQLICCTGVCGICIAEGAKAFWELVIGQPVPVRTVRHVYDN